MVNGTVATSAVHPHPALSHCGGRGFCFRVVSRFFGLYLTYDVNTPFSHRMYRPER